MIDKLDRFHKTKPGLFLFVVIELAITYAFASLSIDRGSLWFYLLALLFLIGALRNLFRLLGLLLNSKAKARR